MQVQIDLAACPSPGSSERFNLARVLPCPRCFCSAPWKALELKEIAGNPGTDEFASSALLAQAAQEISRQVATDIPDHRGRALIAMDIEQMVESLGHRVTGIARTWDEALALFRADPPGMVLADIQLCRRQLRPTPSTTCCASSALPVIFITAFPSIC